MVCTQKRTPDGRFARYLCERCEDEGVVGCPACAGSGSGRWGDPDRSRCLTCNGSGMVPCDNEAHGEERDR